MVSNTSGGQRWRLVDYDVHRDPKAQQNDPKEKKRIVETYLTIYKHLGGVSLRFTDSVYMVREEFAQTVEVAFGKINLELKDAGYPEVEFHVTLIDESMAVLMRKRAVKSLNEQVREIGASLLKSIERLEKKFDPLTDDVNDHLKKTRLKIAEAKRNIEKARGLATLFVIEQDATSGIEAVRRVIEAEEEKRMMAKRMAKAVAKAEASK